MEYVHSYVYICTGIFTDQPKNLDVHSHMLLFEFDANFRKIRIYICFVILSKNIFYSNRNSQ